MHYLQATKVKRKLHESGYQITPAALGVMDAKVDDYLNRLMKTWNGHHKRITPELVSITQLK